MRSMRACMWFVICLLGTLSNVLAVDTTCTSITDCENWAASACDSNYAMEPGEHIGLVRTGTSGSYRYACMADCDTSGYHVRFVCSQASSATFSLAYAPSDELPAGCSVGPEACDERCNIKSECTTCVQEAFPFSWLTGPSLYEIQALNDCEAYCSSPGSEEGCQVCNLAPSCTPCTCWSSCQNQCDN